MYLVPPMKLMKVIRAQDMEYATHLFLSNEYKCICIVNVM